MTDSQSKSQTTPAAGQTWVPTKPRTRQKPKTIEAVGYDVMFEGAEYVQVDGCRYALPFFLRWAAKHQAKVVDQP